MERYKESFKMNENITKVNIFSQDGRIGKEVNVKILEPFQKTKNLTSYFCEYPKGKLNLVTFDKKNNTKTVTDGSYDLVNDLQVPSVKVKNLSTKYNLKPV